MGWYPHNTKKLFHLYILRDNDHACCINRKGLKLPTRVTIWGNWLMLNFFHILPHSHLTNVSSSILDFQIKKYKNHENFCIYQDIHSSLFSCFLHIILKKHFWISYYNHNYKSAGISYNCTYPYQLGLEYSLKCNVPLIQ